VHDPSLGRTRTRIRDSVEVNDPRIRDSSSAYRAGGYTSRRGTTTNIRVFDEGDLTRESFLQYHCFGAPWRDTTDGTVRIAFAPRTTVSDRDGENRVRGTVIVDATTWLTRGVEYEYVRRGQSVGHGTVTYSPVTIEGSIVSMPQRITGDLRLSGRVGIGSMHASWTIVQSYVAFERVVDALTPGM
jgi:hypothetical protein